MSKHERPRTGKRTLGKPLAAALCVLALVLCVVGGTVAWMTDQTEPLVNTFTYGDIDITLTETDTEQDDDSDPNTNTYTMTPGAAIEKDPVVTVLPNSEDAWLFVRLDRSAGFDDFMTYTLADGWAALDGVDGVFWREYTKADTAVEHDVLKDHTVFVREDVTRAMLSTLADYPTLTVTAYAVQRDGEIEAIDTAAEAWALIEGQSE